MNRDSCNNCSQPSSKVTLKACSGCRMVRYCSAACQREAWPRHKRSCATSGEARAALEQPAQRGEKLAFETLMKWISDWSEHLTLFGLGAMDLSNHPDRLRTHVFFLDLSFRTPRPPDRTRWMTMNTGCVLPVADLLARLRARGVPEAQLALIGSLPPTTRGAPADVLQVCVQAGATLRTFECGVNHAARWREIPPDVSAWRAATWVPRLKARIDEGRKDAW
ncbi:hypothetical protein PsYK624_058450 [Phanerochaete sordida]|uniref:MYND-type domain-containing protein n=1 Tax=Phanerochaete sordida TaxID=48140 RepID=A0A9P3LCM7_9APHY|nr:hypothetical protein PsYK624_058450 [Phanerochaete sordida]